MIRVLLFLISGLLPTVAAQAQDTAAEKILYIFPIREEIAPPVMRTVSKAIDQAHKLNADLILIEMNTYGGLVDAADSIRTRILSSRIPVMVLIENNAASAGALISIACDSIYMFPGSTIGAATVVDQTGQQVPDKYQSYMRKKMRSTAEINGRDPDIAEAMVDPDVVIPGIIDSGKVLTFTVNEALQHGFCDAKVNSLSDLKELIGITDYKEVRYEPTTIDSIIGFLINPFISGLLIMLIIGGIYFELQTPGIGFPLMAALAGAVLYFAPLYLEGLAQNWEILIFIAGLGLLAVEIFALPGFGIAGIGGIALMIGSLTLSLVGNVGFTFPMGSTAALLESFLVVIVSSLLAVGLSIYFGSRIIKTGLFNRVVLSADLPSGASQVPGSRTAIFDGMTGHAATVLRPSGKVFIDGQYIDATAESGYISQGDEIEVVRKEVGTVFVRRIKSTDHSS